jgi:hypothetical protein
MPAPVFFSRAYALLALALPGVWLLARALVHRLSRDLGLRAVLPLGLTVALWVAAVQLASLALRSFPLGLPVATVLLAALGVAAELARRRPGADAPSTGRAPSPWMGITAAVTTAAIAPTALKFWIHDEVLTAVHMGTTAQLANVFPPRHLQFPEYPFRYHYGFNVLSASFGAVFHQRSDAAIDISCLSLWFITWCLLWALGERLLGRRRAWLTPAMTLFAGGMPLACSHANRSLVPHLVAECQVSRWSVNSAVINYWFQHPWSLGIPMAVSAILVFTERAPESARVRVALLGLLLGVLSFGQLSLFVTVVPSLLVAELWYDERIEIRRAPAIVLAAVLAFAVAKMLGGFFVPPEGMEDLKFVFHAGFEESPRLTLLWNAMTFGAMWITGVVGFFCMRRGRLFFGLLAGGSLLVVNFVRYATSADIMKFATVASLALGVLGSAAVARILPASRPASSPVRTSIGAALFLGATWVGLFYPFIFAFDLADIPAAYRLAPAQLSADDAKAISFLHDHAGPGEVVFRTRGDGYAQWGGLPVATVDWTTKRWGLPLAKVLAREALLKDHPSDVAVWRGQGFRWLVLDEASKDDKGLVATTDAWIARGEAKLAAKEGSLRIVDIARGRAPAALLAGDHDTRQARRDR